MCAGHPAASGCAGCAAPAPVTTRPVLQLIGEEEDVSVYDIADHPDFRFRTTDIVIRIGNTEDGAPHKEDEVGLAASSGWGAVSLRPVQHLQALEVPPGGPTRPDLEDLWAPRPPPVSSPEGPLPDGLPRASPAGQGQGPTSCSCSLSPGGSSSRS